MYKGSATGLPGLARAMDTDGPATNEQVSFGALLKRYRVAAGLSQEALAERGRLSVRAISAYERELRQIPYRDTVALLVRALGLSPGEAAALEATVPRRRGPAGPSSSAAPPVAAGAELPTGILTFLMTDIEDSTPLWERHETSMHIALRRHDALLAQLLAQHGGRQVKERGEGDALFAVFPEPLAAVLAAVACQQALLAEPWPAETPLRVRMGLHTGSSTLVEGDYYGPVINRCARLKGLGHGGQILLSQACAALVQDRLPGPVALRALGAYSLKGMERPEEVYQVLHPAIPVDFPPLARPQARSGTGALPRTDASSPPFVGRTRELALLERHLAGEGPPLLLLAGEPGIGKSRLLREVATRAARTGWQVLAGGCARRGGQEPYAPLLEALDRHIRRHSSAQLGTALQGCAWLVRLLPELAGGPVEPLPAWTVAPEQERRLLFGAVTRYLANVAGPAGTLLVLDDLQWAGADALDLLATLARLNADMPLRLVGAYRDVEVTPQAPLSVMLADLAHARLAAHRTLGPLSAQEAGQLLDGLLADVEHGANGLRERVVQRTGGMPFFVVSCAQGLRLAGTEDGEHDAVPWDVAQSVRQRAAALPEVAQEVLGVAAVVGRVVPGALLVEVAARPEPDVLPALETACRARLLEEEGDDAYRFAHDVVREVIEAGLGATRRTMLHRRVAEALERTLGEPPIELLAYHYARSAEHEKAVRYGEQAGDRAVAQYGNAAAEGYYRDVLERLERRGQAPDSARVREKLGGVLARMSRYAAALSVLEQTAEAYRTVKDLEGLGRVTAQIGRVHTDKGTPEEGIRHLQPLLEVMAASGPSRSLAALHAALAHLYFVNGRYHELIATATRAVELATALGDEQTVAEAQMRRGVAILLVGRYEEGLALLEETIRLAETAGESASLTTALNGISMFKYMFRGEFDSARRYIERALEVATQVGDPAQISFLTCNRAWIAFYAGDWLRARLDFEQSLALGEQIGVYWRRIYPQTHLARLYLALGEWHLAAQLGEEATTRAAHSGDLQVLVMGNVVLAEGDLREGNPPTACARLVPLLPRLDEDGWLVTFLLPTLAWAYLESGEVIHAEKVAMQAVTRARAIDNLVVLADALRVQALVAIRQGHATEAEQALTEGLSLARQIASPYAEGRMLYVCGTLHAQKGEPGPARERLEAALAIFRRLGARKDAEWAEQALAGIQPL